MLESTQFTDATMARKVDSTRRQGVRGVKARLFTHTNFDSHVETLIEIAMDKHALAHDFNWKAKDVDFIIIADDKYRVNYQVVTESKNIVYCVSKEALASL